MSVYGFWVVPAMAPVVTLIPLTLLAGRRWFRRAGFTRSELLTIYAILLVAGPVASHGMLFWLLPKIVHYYYYGRAMTAWQTTLIPLIPSWYAPSDNTVVSSFFEGGATVPWAAWWLPLAAWGSFLLALMAASGSVIALLQRQWITSERLTFPLAQIPLTLIEPAGTGRCGASLTVSRAFWAGALIAGSIGLLNTIATKFPAVPSIPLGPIPLMRMQIIGPQAGLGEIDLVLWPWLIGLAFMLPTDLSFSCWFFWFVRVGLTVVAIAAGHPPRQAEDWWESGFPAPYNQGGGAMFALGLWALWIARPHLSRAFRIAFSRQSGRADREEALPYRWSLIILCGSFAWMTYFLYLSGCRVAFGATLVVMIIAFYVLWARLRAETGLGFLNMPFEYQLAMGMPFGTGALRPTEIMTLLSMRWAYYPGEGSSFDVCTASLLESMKIADAGGINRRRLTLTLTGALLFALISGTYITLTGIYHYGFTNLAMGGARGITWPSYQSRADGQRTVQMLTILTAADLKGLLGVAAGGVVAVGLGLLRLRFPWWPFHPMGYLVSNVWGMSWFYMPLIIGWLSKVLVLRYGGLRLYRQAIPLATGLIVGDMLTRGVWAVVAIVARGTL
jgi:hypothetical protein